MVKLDPPLGHAPDLGVVGHHHHRAALAVELIDHAHHDGLVHLVEVAGRLIRQHQLRLIDQGARNADPLLLSCRETRRKLIPLVLDTDCP